MEIQKKQITVVTGCVIDGRRILLTQRFEPELPEADRKWDLPGGKTEFGESSSDVVIREVKEETGLDIEPIELIPYIHTNLWRYSDKWLHVVLMCYVCQLTGKHIRPRRQAAEARRATWVDIGEIDLRKTLPGVREFLVWVAREKFGIKASNGNGHHTVYLECVKREENVDKFYFMTDEPPTMPRNPQQLSLLDSERHLMNPSPFVLTRSWGRRGGPAKSIQEEYYSEMAVLRRMAEILRERQSKNYRIVESTLGDSYDEAFSALQTAAVGDS